MKKRGLLTMLVALAMAGPLRSEATGQQGPPSTREFPTERTAISAGVGSLAGLLGGAWYGQYQASQPDLARGLVLGSFAGAALGGSAASGHVGPAVLGSAVGVLAGLAIHSALPGGSTELAFLSYSVTQGVVTSLVTRAFR